MGLFTLPGDITSHERGVGKSRKGTELVSVRIREGARWSSGGKQGESSRDVGTVDPGQPGHSRGCRASSSGVGEGRQHSEQALPWEGAEWELPRVQPEQGQQEERNVAHAWGQTGRKMGIETITGGRVWLQPVQP